MKPTFEYHLALLPHQRYLTLVFQFLRSSLLFPMYSIPVWAGGRKQRRNAHGKMKARTYRPYLLHTAAYSSVPIAPRPLSSQSFVWTSTSVATLLLPSPPVIVAEILADIHLPVHLPRQVRRISCLEFDTFRFILTRALDGAMILYPRFRALRLSQRPRQHLPSRPAPPSGASYFVSGI
jgi:hypothetical protein